MIWFIVLNVVMSNGDVYTNIHYPNKPEYNNEQSCNEAGQQIVDAKQLEIGTKSGTAYFSCQVITAEEIKKATQKPGQDI